MKRILRRLALWISDLWHSDWTGIAIAVAVVGGVLWWLTGCAAGKGPGGEIVVGFDVGRVVESAPEAATMLAKMLPPPFGTIATGGIALLAGWGAEKRARNRENQSWEESQREAERKAALERAALLTPIASAVAKEATT